MSDRPEEQLFREYLGDGVYASFDGYQIWLAANHQWNRVIALEPDVFNALVQYERNLMLRLQQLKAQT